MKVLLIVCAVVLALQLAVLGYSFSGGDKKPPSREEVEDGDWDPAEEYPMTAWADDLFGAFRTRIELPERASQHFAVDETVSLQYRHDSKDKRVIAEFELISGEGVMIRYTCGIFKKGYTCPEQIACLCSPGATIDPDHFAACGDARPQESECPEEGDIGEVIVYSKIGELEFTGLGNAGGTVKLN